MDRYRRWELCFRLPKKASAREWVFYAADVQRVRRSVGRIIGWPEALPPHFRRLRACARLTPQRWHIAPTALFSSYQLLAVVSGGITENMQAVVFLHKKQVSHISR